jgi:uncharacterized SAM-binding protein YcdF (DUF218 family)
MKKMFSKSKHLTMALLPTLLGWVALSAYSIAAYANHSEEQPVDGIIVLGAAAFGTQPSPVFRERINHAVRLYQDGYARMIIFTGGKGEGEQTAESQAAKEYAEMQGIPPSSILIETSSKTTEENLYYAQCLMIERGIERVIIVSDPLHMKRAMVIARDMGIKACSSPTPTSQYRGWKTQLSFLGREVYYYQRYLLKHFFRSRVLGVRQGCGAK